MSMVTRSITTTFVRGAVLALGLTLFTILPATAYELRSGVVIESASDIAFVAMPNGGIEALNLRSTNVVWTSMSADMPVVVHDGRLITYVEAPTPGHLYLVILDARTGSVLQTADASLPEDVHALIDDRLGEQFRLRAEPGQGSLLLTWRYSHRVISGAKTELSDTPPRVNTGAFELELDTFELNRRPMFEEPRNATIELIGSDRLSRVTGRQFRARDGGFVLASERLRDQPADKEYLWTIFTKDGDHLGEIPSAISYAPYHVANMHVIFVQQPSIEIEANDVIEHPLSLRALSLTGGTELWIETIRDTKYYGPFPS